MCSFYFQRYFSFGFSWPYTCKDPPLLWPGNKTQVSNTYSRQSLFIKKCYRWNAVYHAASCIKFSAASELSKKYLSYVISIECIINKKRHQAWRLHLPYIELHLKIYLYLLASGRFSKKISNFLLSEYYGDGVKFRATIKFFLCGLSIKFSAAKNRRTPSKLPCL